MQSCWQEALTKRPTFPALQAKFEQILTLEGDTAYIDFSINPEMKCYEDPDESQDTPSSAISSSPDPLNILSIEARDGMTANTGGQSPWKESSLQNMNIHSTVSSERSTLVTSITGVLPHVDTCQEESEKRYVDNPSVTLSLPSPSSK